jgi:hypothetical protein
VTRRELTQAFFALGLFAPGVAFAQSPQTSNYSSVEVIAGKSVQLGYHASAAKNCKAAPPPAVRVVQPPKAGMLIVRRGALTTDRVGGCPRLQTPAQVVFYQARVGHAGTDHVVYEVTGLDGEVSTYDVSVEVKEPTPTSSDGKGI